MAQNKYVDLAGLTYYDGKIKDYIATKDSETLASAKAHAEGLAPNYDAAGTAETKVNALANGQVKTNTDAIAAINNENTGILKQAKDYADGKDSVIAEAKKAGTDAQAYAEGVQDNVDALAAKVGEVAEGQTVMGIIQNIQENAYDDTEIRGLISGNADDISGLDERLTTAEGKVTTLIGEDANKSVRTIANEELAKQLIADNAADSMNELAEIAAWIQAHPNDASAMNKAITDLQALVGTLPSGVSATTIVGYVQELVNAEKARAEGIESGLDSRLQTIEGKLGTGTGSVTEQVANAKSEAIAAAASDAKTKADTAEQNAKGYADDLNAAMDTRMLAVEGAKHTHSNADVLNGITAGKVSAWDAAEQNAKDYADGLNSDMNERVEELEGKKHEHSNKALLDTYKQTEANLADAVAKKHEHTNKTVLDGITSEQVSNWDNASAGNHSHTNMTILDGINSAKVNSWDTAASKAHEHTNKTVLDGITADKVSGWDALDGKIEQTKNDITLEVADQFQQHNNLQNATLSGLSNRIKALEDVTYVAITEAEIDGLFA